MSLRKQRFSYKNIDVHTKWKNSKGYVYEVLHIANVAHIHERHPVSIIYKNLKNNAVYSDTVEYFLDNMQKVSYSEGHNNPCCEIPHPNAEITTCLLLQPDQKPKRKLFKKIINYLLKVMRSRWKLT